MFFFVEYSMKLKSFLQTVAYIDTIDVDGESFEVWKSKHDHSYLGHVCLDDDLQFLLDYKITDQLTHGLGFSPENNQWYGWTHRGLHGFGIGSTCEIGDVHYKPSNLQELIDNTIMEYSDDLRDNVNVELVKEGVLAVSWTYKKTITNPNLRGKRCEIEHDYNSRSFGKGQWVAKNLEDAKQMAIDLRNNLS